MFTMRTPGPCSLTYLIRRNARLFSKIYLQLQHIVLNSVRRHDVIATYCFEKVQS